MHHTLIVARMDPANADAVARIFAESDATDLPHRAAVTRRSLFRFHGLYFHLIESQAGPDLAAIRDTEGFAEVNTRLSDYITAYRPQQWRAPQDAMATPFYDWHTC